MKNNADNNDGGRQDMTTYEIQVLLNDLENDRTERTVSTTNTDKFGQAICAFANDLPNHQCWAICSWV